MILETVASGEIRQQSAVVGSPLAISNGRWIIDPLRDPRWLELVKKHPAASVFHSREWFSALHLAYGYEPVVYTNCDPSAELTSGIVFCKVSSWLTGRRLVSLPFSDHCDALVENSDEFDDSLLTVRASVDSGEWDYCEVRPVRFDPGHSTGLRLSDA